MTAPLLKVDDYHVNFGDGPDAARAVDGVSFELERGRTLGIVGESGSGKSVLSRSIMGLVPSSQHRESGFISFDGLSLVGTDRQPLWGKRIAMIFQDPMTSLNPVMRIGRQIAEPLRLHLGLNKKQAARRATDLLDQVGIPEPVRRLRQYPHELSGGMRQRVMIAIAISAEPDLLIADEPTTALDVTVQRRILDLLASIAAERSMAMILISHDLGVIRGRADDVMVMYGGQVMELSNTQTLFAQVRHPYTDALLSSIPRLTQPKHTELTSIEGLPPDPSSPSTGCRFADRCPQVHPNCHSEAPALRLYDGRRLACHYPVGA